MSSNVQDAKVAKMRKDVLGTMRLILVLVGILGLVVVFVYFGANWIAAH